MSETKPLLITRAAFLILPPGSCEQRGERWSRRRMTTRHTANPGRFAISEHMPVRTGAAYGRPPRAGQGSLRTVASQIAAAANLGPFLVHHTRFPFGSAPQRRGDRHGHHRSRIRPVRFMRRGSTRESVSVRRDAIRSHARLLRVARHTLPRRPHQPRCTHRRHAPPHRHITDMRILDQLCTGA